MVFLPRQSEMIINLSTACILCKRKLGTMRHAKRITIIVILCAFSSCLAACHSSGDADLETMEYAKSTISLDSPAAAHITDGNNIEVEGNATNHDKFQHDVYFTATLWDANGKSVGTATGKLEDWPAGHHGIYKLEGTTSSTTWARVSVEVSKVTEHVRGQVEE